MRQFRLLLQIHAADRPRRFCQTMILTKIILARKGFKIHTSRPVENPGSEVRSCRNAILLIPPPPNNHTPVLTHFINNNNNNNMPLLCHIIKHLFYIHPVQWSGGSVLARPEHSPLECTCYMFFANCLTLRHDTNAVNHELTNGLTAWAVVPKVWGSLNVVWGHYLL
jgi:hypothetical protein